MIYNGTDSRDTPVIQNEDEVLAYGNGGDDIMSIINTGSGSGSVEVYGGDGWDIVSVSGAGEVLISGGKGNDTLMAEDVMHARLMGGAGDGSDTMMISNGSGLMKGGGGDDAYIFNLGEDVSIKELALEGLDSVQLTRNGGVSTDYYRIAANVEDLYFMGPEDSMTRLEGNSADNKIISLSGAMVDIDGGTGNDWIEATVSNEGSVFAGGNGDDYIKVNAFFTTATVYGGNGNDIIDASGSQLWGGEGKDTFMLRDGMIYINDFNGGDDDENVDRIELTDWSSAHGLDVGTLAERNFNIGARAYDKSDRIIWDDESGNLYYDSDGSGAAKQELIGCITVADRDLVHSDFFVT